MEQLWAPWRMDFIERPKEGTEECIFCDFPPLHQDEEHYILYRGSLAFIMLNAYPYNNGHLLVAAYHHANELNYLPAEEKLQLMELTDLGCQALAEAYRPEGYNIGINLGKVAGAGIPGHLHVHIVPRWNGDTNFMPVLGNTRVLPEALDVSFKRLKAVFDSLASKAP